MLNQRQRYISIHNHIGGVTVSVLTLSVEDLGWGMVGSYQTIKLVFVASPLSTLH